MVYGVLCPGTENGSQGRNSMCMREVIVRKRDLKIKK